MNLVYVIMSTLIMVGYLKSVIGNLFMNHNPKFHISNYQDELSKIKELLQSLNLESEDNALEYSKEEKNTHFIPNDTTEKSEIRLPQDESYSRDAIELLLNTYTDTLRRKLKLSEENEKHDEIRKNDKRALTMLSRWKPFRLNNLNGGNGRHVIRSPFTSRSDPNSFNKIQIMGRPFRWG